MPSQMPDIATNAKSLNQGTLDWVGMSNIELPLMLQGDDGSTRQISAKAKAMVNLTDPLAKGIHMSRLYLALDELSISGDITPQSISELLNAFIASHDGLSDSAKVELEFDYHLRRESLLSGKTGWKAYPVHINAELIQGKLTTQMTVKVPYSSTCPCSAALARQLIQEAFSKNFTDSTASVDDVIDWLGTTDGIVATPHSQRSIADINVTLNGNSATFPIISLIDCIESALKTPVQAAVKREDEQEFARLNGQNLMFVEDAARKLQNALATFDFCDDFNLSVNHLESLHAHDAISITSKRR